MSKADALSGMHNIMILRPSIEKCLFGIAAMGFPDPGGRERFFFFNFSNWKFNDLKISKKWKSKWTCNYVNIERRKKTTKKVLVFFLISMRWDGIPNKQWFYFGLTVWMILSLETNNTALCIIQSGKFGQFLLIFNHYALQNG